MNKILIGMLFALSASAAFAQSGSPANNASNSDEKVQVEVTAADRAAANAAADRFCLRQTGSHVHAIVKAGQKDSAVQCVNAPGRSYTRADLEGTGALTTAEALRRLDPSLR